MSESIKIDPKLDLVFERTSGLTPEQIWKGWTDPQTLMKWFCPGPWRVTDCRIDLKLGGEFYNVMKGPNGEKMQNDGCYLEVIPNQKLVWTGMLSKGFRPTAPDSSGFPFVATILISKTDQGTSYKAIVAHADVEGRSQHEQMGFHEGWGKAFDQLVALATKDWK